jgi:8-oxo-dGTP diphosphatase
MFESWDQCAEREVLEECDLILERPVFGHVTNDPMPEEKKHYVTIFMLATCKITDPLQAPKNMEPNKCLGWESYSWDELGKIQEKGKLFGPLDVLVRQNPKAITDFFNLDSSDR